MANEAVLVVFGPGRFPEVHVCISLLFTLIIWAVCRAVGMILNFSLLVCTFDFLSNLFVLSISLSTVNFIIGLDLLGDVITCVLSSAYITSELPYSEEGKALV